MRRCAAPWKWSCPARSSPGVTIGAISHPDIVDVHVALAASERGHAVLTSDDGAIAGVNPKLVLIHV